MCLSDAKYKQTPTKLYQKVLKFVPGRSLYKTVVNLIMQPYGTSMLVIAAFHPADPFV